MENHHAVSFLRGTLRNSNMCSHSNLKSPPLNSKLSIQFDDFPIKYTKISFKPPFQEDFALPRLMKPDGKQDAAHEPDCSHVEHFCGTRHLNSLGHFSPLP